MLSRLILLAKLLYNPLEAMAGLRGRAPYGVGTLLALIASLVYYDALGGDLFAIMAALKGNGLEPGSALVFIRLFFLVLQGAAPVVFLAVIFSPATLFAASLLDRRTSFAIMLRQEYAAILSCILYSWTAAHLVMFIPSLLLFQQRDLMSGAAEFAVRVAPLPYFGFLVVLAVRVLIRLSYAQSVAAVVLAACSLIALPLVPNLLFILSSPFLMILIIILLRNFLGEMVSSHRARERFKQNLETATLNPADASAHYNLGLIYQQRGLYEEATRSFKRAIEIDPEETDAYYQLGRIAREQERLADAITYFDSVVRRNPEHSQNEVWREIGCAYFQAGQYEDARVAFEQFLEKRAGDAEGRFRYGLTLYRLGRSEEAAAEMRTVIESVRTSPAYKYRAEKRWMNEAQSFLRSSPASSK